MKIKLLKTVLSTLLFIIFSCNNSGSVKIGLIGDFSSKEFTIGTSGRNGAQLAIEEINKAGGINNRPVELISINHEGSKDRCYSAVKELVNNGVSVIIGPYLSSMAQSAKVASIESNTLMISPTVSSEKLSGIDDNFIRLIPQASTQGTLLGKLLKKDGRNSTLAILDNNNKEYSFSVFEGLKQTLDKQSITVDEIILYGNVNTKLISDYVDKTKPDSMVFITSGQRSAEIINALDNRTGIKLYGCNWTKASGFLTFGTEKIEGMVLIDSYQNIEPTDKELKFYKDYNDEFGIIPELGAKYSYEAVYLFKNAYENSRNKSGKSLKSTIYEMKKFQGVSDEFQFDRYGDVFRYNSFFVVENKEYRLMD